jgi:hypothetical protein
MAKFLKALAYFGKELVEYNRDPKAWVQAWEARHAERTYPWGVPQEVECGSITLHCCSGVDPKFVCGECECQMADLGCDYWCTCTDCEPKWEKQVSDECLYYREPGVQCKCPRCYY